MRWQKVASWKVTILTKWRIWQRFAKGWLKFIWDSWRRTLEMATLTRNWRIWLFYALAACSALALRVALHLGNGDFDQKLANLASSLSRFIIGLAALVNYYVKAINTPEAIPNVQRAWDHFVTIKCSDAIKNALVTYDALLNFRLWWKKIAMFYYYISCDVNSYGNEF